MTGKQQDLMLDAYLPPDSDSRAERPAVVFMHGGGFKAGNKRGGRKLALMLAARGYAVFSVNYRLTGGYHEAETQGQVFDAQEDFRAAIRFVRSKAEDYRLDTDKIVASGYSAGAITALQMTYAEPF